MSNQKTMIMEKKNDYKNLSKVAEYKVKDDDGNDVVFGTYVPKL